MRNLLLLISLFITTKAFSQSLTETKLEIVEKLHNSNYAYDLIYSKKVETTISWGDVTKIICNYKQGTITNDVNQDIFLFDKNNICITILKEYDLKYINKNIEEFNNKLTKIGNFQWTDHSTNSPVYYEIYKEAAHYTLVSSVIPFK